MGIHPEHLESVAAPREPEAQLPSAANSVNPADRPLSVKKITK
jgi:hypothetical protein